jgi:polysaccharide export outer membrane protein
VGRQPEALSGPQAAEIGQSADTATGVIRGESKDRDTEVLENLWKDRVDAASRSAVTGDFALGPGDVLRISVPQIEQLRDRTVRVSEENTIALPLLGVINTAAMSEKDLRNELTRRLSKYMYRPQLAVFLQQTENRQVAVLGSVKKPGRYMLTSHSDTIMTMLSRAKGMNEDAAARIVLIPARAVAGSSGVVPIASTRAQGIAPGASPASDSSHFENSPNSSNTAPNSGNEGSDALIASAKPEVLAEQMRGQYPVIRLSRSENQRFLELPVKPGDVIIVPAAGEVTVQGWVDKPGSFKITPGMTVLSSIAAAGGALFSSSATLLREQSKGGKLQIPLDLPQIKNGEEADVPVQGGDVVVVERSVIGAVPYSLYYLLSRIGVGIPMAF